MKAILCDACKNNDRIMDHLAGRLVLRHSRAVLELDLCHAHAESLKTVVDGWLRTTRREAQT